MLFTGYDIRGIFKKDLTLEIIYNVVQQFFQKLKIKKALLAVDFNKNNWLIKNFLEKKFPFEFLGILPTPIFYYEVIKRKKPGIMITASHLPLKYSGLKFILENGEPWKPIHGLNRLNTDNTDKKYPHKTVLDLHRSANKNPYKSALDLYKSVYENYFNYLQKIINPKKKIYVSFDKKNLFLNYSLPYFQKLKIYEIDNVYPNDARIKYPNKGPNKNLKFGKNSGDKFGQYSGRLSLIKIKSDFDNDRIFVFINNRKIHNDLIFYFLAKLPQYQKLGVPIFFSQKLKNELLQFGKKIYLIPTGHYFFKKAFKKYKLDLAFEPSGHFYMFKDLKTEGPYLALGLFLHLIEDLYGSNADKRGLKDFLNLNSSLQLYRFDIKLTNNLPGLKPDKPPGYKPDKSGSYPGSPSWRNPGNNPIRVNPRNKNPRESALLLKKLVSFLQKKFKLKLKKFDGYFLYNQDFYLHLRKSKTENKIRVSYEGSKRYLKEIKKWLMKI
jgi:phosphomannomutase